MREILFRGFQPCDGPDTIVVDGEKVKGRWVEGYLYITHTGEYEIGGYCEEYNVERYTYNVLPSTVGQYTGLTDKNGKRIFEGDIVETKFGRPCKVTFKALPSFCGFDLDPITGNHKKPDVYDLYWKENLAVIGTVFDEEAHNAQN